MAALATHPKAVQRELQKMKDMGAPALPETCSWVRVEEFVQEANAMVSDLAKATVEKVRQSLEACMNELDLIAYGSNDGVPWYNAYNDNPTPASWDSSVATLNTVEIKKLDAAVALCEKELAAAMRVADTFSSPQAFVDLQPAADRIMSKAKCTKIEGTIMFILRTHAADPAAQRSKCEKQRRLAKKLEENREPLLHPKVRELMQAALKF